MQFFSNKKSVLESALYYANAGYKVFPCFYNGNDDGTKGHFSPFCQHGYKAATIDIKKVAEWWMAHPDALIAVVTGAESGILAVTVDKNSDFTAKTPCFTSNFGEKTYIFKNPENKKIGSGKIEGFKFCGEAGFIVVPPAAGDYRLEIVADGELLEVPAEILNKIKDISAVEAVMNELLPVEAQRQQEQQAQEGTAPVDQEGQEEDDQEEESGLPELPLHCLPPRLQKVVSGTALSMNVDPWLSFAAAMQAVSAAVGANYKIDGLISAPAHMWTAIVGPSGSGKSALCRLFAAPIHNKQKFYDDSFASNLKEYEKELKIYEENFKTWVKAGREGEEPKEPIKPTCKTYFVDDITSEKLQLTLAENPSGVCWSPDELTKLLGSFGRYSKGGKSPVDPAKSAILSAYDGGSSRTSRMGREQETAKEAWLSIYGTIQPEILESSFQKEDLYSGFLHRFIFIVLTDQATIHEKDRPRPDDFKQEIADIFEPLLYGHEIVLEKYASEKDLLDKKTEPKRIYIEEKGKLLIQDYNFSLGQAADNSKKLGEVSNVGNLKTMAKRLCGHLPRLVLILHAMECAEKGIEISNTVSTQTVERTIEIFTAITKHIYHAWGLITGKQKIVAVKKEECLEVLATIDPYINKNGNFYELSYTDVYKGQKLADILCNKLFAEGGTKQKLTKALEKIGFSSWRRESGKVMRIEKADYETKFLKAVGTKKIVVKPQDAGAEVSNIF